MNMYIVLYCTQNRFCCLCARHGHNNIYRLCGNVVWKREWVICQSVVFAQSVPRLFSNKVVKIEYSVN